MDVRYMPEDSVLDPEEDEQLIKGLEGYAKIAGIEGHPECIWRSILNNKCVLSNDLDLLDKIPFKNSDKMGVVYIGYGLSNITRKFMALTGYLVRNYIDARYTDRSTLLQIISEQEDIEGKIFFCPDFYVREKKGAKNSIMPQWKRDILFSFFLKCQAESKDIILAIQNWGAAEEHYGSEITNFIEDNFMEIE